MLDNFEETTVEQDENGLLWIRNKHGNIVCEAYFQAEDETNEQAIKNNYIRIPYTFKGEDVFVQVISND